MKNKLPQFVVLLLLATFLLHSCRKESVASCSEHEVASCGADSSKTNIRLQNISAFTLCNVDINACCAPVNHGIVDPQEFTCYRAYDSAWASSSVYFSIDSTNFAFQPIDHVGESALPRGNYTIQLNVTDPTSGQMTIAFVPD